MNRIESIESIYLSLSKLVNSDNNTNTKEEVLIRRFNWLNDLNVHHGTSSKSLVISSNNGLVLTNINILNSINCVYIILLFFLLLRLSCTSSFHSEFWICTSTEAQNQQQFSADDVACFWCFCVSFEPSFVRFSRLFSSFLLLYLELDRFVVKFFACCL